MPDDDDDDDDNDDPMILNIRAKNHTSERTIVPWTVIFLVNRTIGPSFIEIGPKLGVLILAIGESQNMAILRVPLTETAVTRKRKVEKWIRRCQNFRLREGYKRAIDEIRGPIAKNGLSGQNPKI